MEKVLTFLLLISMAVSCKQTDKFAQARKQYEESLKIHDELMPQMMELNKIRQELNMRRDSITDPGLKIQIDSLISSLDFQNSNMRDWMKNIQHIPGDEYPGMEPVKSEDYSPEELLKAQTESLEKIKNLQTTWKESIMKAKEFLDKPLE